MGGKQLSPLKLHLQLFDAVCGEHVSQRLQVLTLSNHTGQVHIYNLQAPLTGELLSAGWHGFFVWRIFSCFHLELLTGR